MSNQDTINKMRENVLEGANKFVGISPNYCDNQDCCKIVLQITNQYKQVVKQNQSLQQEVLWQKAEMEKDNQYLIKLEEANMLYEIDIEALKRRVDYYKELYVETYDQLQALKERYEGNEN